MLDIVQITRFFDLVDGTPIVKIRCLHLPKVSEDFFEFLPEAGGKRVVITPVRLVGLLNALSTDAPSTQVYRDEVLAFLRG